MMRRLGVLGLVVLGAGCAGTGLTPFPEEVAQGERKPIGLDPFPAPRKASTRSVGLSAFPEVDSSKARKPIGLDPFPAPKGAKPAGASAPAKAPAAAPPAAKPEEKPAAKPAEAPAAAPRIAFKFEKGATSRYRTTIDTTMKNPMFGENGLKMKMGMDLRQEVRDIRADGAGVVASTFESVAMEMDNPMMGAFKFDTRDGESMKKAKENPMLGQMVDLFSGMVGKSLEITMDRSGNVLAMGDMKELLGSLGAAMGGDMSNQMSGVPSPFPETPIFEGLSWPLHQEQANPMGKMVTDGTMKVKAWDPATGMATIQIEGTVTLSAPENADEGDMAAQMAAMIKMKDAKMSGTMVFDVGRGRLESSHTVMSMAMENPMMGGDMTVEAVADMALIP